MRLLRGTEIRLDPQMQPQHPAFEPASATHGEMYRLRNMDETEQPRVEADRRALTTRRHGQLHVFERHDLHDPAACPRTRLPRLKSGERLTDGGHAKLRPHDEHGAGSS